MNAKKRVELSEKLLCELIERAEKAEAEVERLKQKEIPMIPKVEAVTDEEGYKYEHLSCPVCGDMVGTGHDEDDDGVIKYNLYGKYCSECGQKIDEYFWRCEG
jgi:hypothetical protein